MSDPSSSSSTSFIAKTPFDWLHGGLFFGKTAAAATTTTSTTNSNNKQDDDDNDTNIDRVDTSNNVFDLLIGIQRNLNELATLFTARTTTTITTAMTKVSLSDDDDQTQQQNHDQTSSEDVVIVDPTTNNEKEQAEQKQIEVVVDYEEKMERSRKWIAARLSRLRFLLYDERRITSSSSLSSPSTVLNVMIASNTIQALTTSSSSNSANLTELVIDLLKYIFVLPFESRKHSTAIINYLLVCGLDGYDRELYSTCMNTFVQYIHSHFDTIMTILVQGHYPTSTILVQQQSLSETTTTATTVDTTAAAAAVSATTTIPPTTTSTDIGLHFGSIYRSIIRHPVLYNELVGSSNTTENVTKFVYPFFDTLIHVPNFEISSDSMETLRSILNAGTSTTTGSSTSSSSSSNDGNNNKSNDPNTNSATILTKRIQEEEDERVRQMGQIACDFLVADYTNIFDKRYTPQLLDVDNVHCTYMTRRIALQILSIVLLTRTNYPIMIQYVSNRYNLIVIMKLLRDRSPHISLDAFHVFKIFVANPNKHVDIIKILKDNQIKLCTYLQTSFHNEREEYDVQFRDEKQLIIETIEQL